MATVTEYDFTISPFNSDQFTALINSSSISTALAHINTDGSAIAIFFKDVLSDGDVATLNALVSAYVYAAPVPNTSPISVVAAGPVNPDGVPIHEMALRRGNPGFIGFTIVSHDFSDRTTWYQKSIQVTGETLTNPSSDGLNYAAANPNWINMNSGKLTYDWNKVLERDGSLTNASHRFVTITSNGTPLVEGTDFTVNYPMGTVLFTANQSANTIVAGYWHNTGVSAPISEFLITPPPNYCYRVDHIEGQFSQNITFNSPIAAEIWAGAVTGGGTTVNLAGYGGFAPAYYNAGYGQSRSIYRNINDLFNWCIHQYPVQPAAGGLTQPVLCLPFLYVVHPVINSAQGIVVRLYCTTDAPASAEICTITFYMEKGPSSGA